MAEYHADQFFPTRKAFGVPFSVVFTDNAAECTFINM
jgi:hypothetical protein